MPPRKPKLWVTRAFHSTETKGEWLDLVTWAQESADYVEIQDRYWLKDFMPDRYWPTGLYVKYRKGQAVVIEGIKDVCVVKLGMTVISKRFHDLLQDFNIGQTALRAMPVYGHDRETRFPEEYYMMQMLEYRSFVRVEEMEVVSHMYDDLYQWMPNKPAHKPVVALPADHDLDLWMDHRIFAWTFVSDRLRNAIKEAGLRGGQLGFRPCKVVEV